MIRLVSSSQHINPITPTPTHPPTPPTTSLAMEMRVGFFVGPEPGQGGSPIRPPTHPPIQGPQHLILTACSSSIFSTTHPPTHLFSLAMEMRVGFFVGPEPGQEEGISDQERLYRVVAGDWHPEEPQQVRVKMPTHPPTHPPTHLFSTKTDGVNYLGGSVLVTHPTHPHPRFPFS